MHLPSTAEVLVGYTLVSEGTWAGGNGLGGLASWSSLVGLDEAKEWMHREVGADFLFVVVGLSEVEVGLDYGFDLWADGLVNDDGELGKVAGVEVERRVEGAGEKLGNDGIE